MIMGNSLWRRYGNEASDEAAILFDFSEQRAEESYNCSKTLMGLGFVDCPPTVWNIFSGKADHGQQAEINYKNPNTELPG